MNQRSEMNIDVSLYVAKAALATTAVPLYFREHLWLWQRTNLKLIAIILGVVCFHNMNMQLPFLLFIAIIDIIAII